MKSKKKILILIICVFILILSGAFTCFYFMTPNRLTSEEKKHIASITPNIQNMNVLNNVDVFGDAGEGIFYDFLQDFSTKYGLKVNTVAFNLDENTNGINFMSSNLLGENDLVFYQSHYVLVGKKEEFLASKENLSGRNIGVYQENIEYVNRYFEKQYSFKTYEKREDLLNDFKNQTNIQYMIVPLHLYLEEILKNNYSIVSHYEDIPYYFKINSSTDNLLFNVLKKFYIRWEKEHLEEYYLNHLFNLFVKALNISVAEIDTMRSVVYQYGFVENKPYEILSGGKYAGIIAQYLKEFMSFSGTDIQFLKYKTLPKFTNALSQNKINLYFGFYDVLNNYVDVHSGIGIPVCVLAPQKDSVVVDSLNSLYNKTIYVSENSSLSSYLKNTVKSTVKTYKNDKELKKIVKNNEIIVVDCNFYLANRDVYRNYSLRYQETLDTDYVFKISTNEVFNKLFSKFSAIKSPNESVYQGIYNYDLTLRAGTITGTIARYSLYILVILIVSFLYIYRVTKKVKLSKKIKKEDKLKYIDQLTSLKNRNYLTENLEAWSQNTIYPQTVIVIDLNNLQYINDTMGYEQGDEQIKATANILVKTQLDNSDIIRTDGNEFVIYLVGYSLKQVTSFIHKLNKEFKKLPYEYGAAIGYSMIEDKIKSVEDAINEAVEDVKKQKEKRDKKEGINEK